MNLLAFGFGNLGGPDLIVILLIVLVLFGAKKLPELARGLGQSMNEFRKAREDFERELHNTGTQSSPAKPPQPTAPLVTVVGEHKKAGA
jgi:sec-independent protein translocase protein TatA